MKELKNMDMALEIMSTGIGIAENEYRIARIGFVGVFDASADKWRYLGSSGKVDNASWLDAFSSPMISGRDLPVVVPMAYWQERMRDDLRNNGSDHLLMVADAMWLREAQTRQNGSYESKGKLRDSMENFNRVLCRFITPGKIDWMRDTFAERISIFNPLEAGQTPAKMVERLGCNDTDKWRAMSVKKRMEWVYKAIDDKPVKDLPGRVSLEMLLADGDVPMMDPKVYQEYRGGGIKNGRPGIETFDRGVGYLCKIGLMRLSKGFFDPTVDLSNEEVKLVRERLVEISANWPNKAKEDPAVVFLREVVAAVERWGLNCLVAQSKLTRTIDRDDEVYKYFKFAGKENGVSGNPGWRVGVGLVLTEKTRVCLMDSINHGYKAEAQKLHPESNIETDIEKRRRNEERLKILNDARQCLKTENNFRAVSGGW